MNLKSKPPLRFVRPNNRDPCGQRNNRNQHYCKRKPWYPHGSSPFPQPISRGGWFRQSPLPFRNSVRHSAGHIAQFRAHLRIVVQPRAALFAIRKVPRRLPRQRLAVKQRGNTLRSFHTIHLSLLAPLQGERQMRRNSSLAANNLDFTVPTGICRISASSAYDCPSTSRSHKSDRCSSAKRPSASSIAEKPAADSALLSSRFSGCSSPLRCRFLHHSAARFRPIPKTYERNDPSSGLKPFGDRHIWVNVSCIRSSAACGLPTTCRK